MSDSFRVALLEALGAVDAPSPPRRRFRGSGTPSLGPQNAKETPAALGRSLLTSGDRCRVIDCKDSIQWIIQRLRGQQWHGYSFHRNRDVLIERSQAAGDALKALKALPEIHPHESTPRSRP